jgi:hypothetical protein
VSLNTEGVVGRTIVLPTYAKEKLRLPIDFSPTRERKPPHFVKCFLDSGVYACWKNGQTIDIDEYIDYIKRNLDWIEYYASLDKIPAEPGRYPTKAEVEYSAKVSYDNHQYMKAAGLHPIPIYHQGEELEHLERYLADGETYIGISPQEDLLSWRGLDPMKWLDRVFTRLTNSRGIPIIKTHGFGVMGPSLLRRYPWHSVDATSFTHQANYGAIFVPKYIKGKPDYLADPNYVHVSDNTKRVATTFSSLKEKSKIQFGNLSRAQQDQVVRFVEEECNSCMTLIRYCDNERRKAAITWWHKVVEALAARPDAAVFRYRSIGF